MRKAAIYPGTFDPITNGHLDLITRGVDLFDHLTVAVAHNKDKRPLFSVTERVEMIREAVAHLKKVAVISFDELLIDYAIKNNINIVIRGLRVVSDFEYELQMGFINRRLSSSSVETVFMIPSEQFAYLSSNVVKEVASFGGDIKGFVPGVVADRLMEKLKDQTPPPNSVR
jgi:pantetheine-phosphate adenylyltransferase